LFVDKLKTFALSFGVVAPPATHWTSFEEHGGSNSRAVMNGVSLNVENNAFLHLNS
jgi:hypothetical protein